MNNHDGRSWANLANAVRIGGFSPAVLDQQISRLLHEDGRRYADRREDYTTSPENMSRLVADMLPDYKFETGHISRERADKSGEPAGWFATLDDFKVMGRLSSTAALCEAFCMVMSHLSENEDDHERDRHIDKDRLLEAPEEQNLRSIREQGDPTHAVRHDAEAREEHEEREERHDHEEREADEHKDLELVGRQHDPEHADELAE